MTPILAVLSGPDALAIGALITVGVPAVFTWLNSRKAVQQTRPNGGSTMRDSLDRIERKLDDHGERLAIIEAAHGDRRTTRTRSTD